MGISRRGLGALAAGIGLLAGKRAKACSPSPDYLEMPTTAREFFRLVSEGELEKANDMLVDSARLSIVTPNSQKFYERENIARRLHFMLSSEGWQMIGDSKDRRNGGMYWVDWSGWVLTDILRKQKVELSSCGGVYDPVRNVFMALNRAKGARSITNIMILESHELALRNPLGEVVTDY